MMGVAVDIASSKGQQLALASVDGWFVTISWYKSLLPVSFNLVARI